MTDLDLDPGSTTANNKTRSNGTVSSLETPYHENSGRPLTRELPFSWAVSFNSCALEALLRLRRTLSQGRYTLFDSPYLCK